MIGGGVGQLAAWALAAAAVTLTASGQVSLKVGVDRSSRAFFALGLVMLLAAIGAAFAAAYTLHVGQVFMLTAFTPLITMMAASRLIGEEIPLRRWLAVGVCVVGVLLYQLGG